MSGQTGLSAARMSARWQLRKERERALYEDRNQDGVDDPFGPMPVDRYMVHSIARFGGCVEMTEAETNVTLRDIDFETRASDMMRAMREHR